MIKHDIVHHPTTPASKNKATLSTIKADLEKNPLENLPQQDLLQVRSLSIYQSICLSFLSISLSAC